MGGRHFFSVRTSLAGVTRWVIEKEYAVRYRLDR
jgi:hypothetical protein